MPYNPYLSRLMQCHLNVEFCGSVRSVKYLYKYTYKGHDRATVEISSVDEISRFLDSRYVGPPEACWRLLEYPMHDKSHTIVRLAVHDDMQHSLVFKAGEAKNTLDKAAEASTTLLAWFKLNEKEEKNKEK